MNEVIGIIIAAILCWLNFVIVDTYFGLPEQPGVKGARIIVKMSKREGEILLVDFSKETFYVLRMHLLVH